VAHGLWRIPHTGAADPDAWQQRCNQSCSLLLLLLLFRRVWRMDSGDYPTLAQLIMDAWQQRCSERQAAGLAALPRPQLMHSNISSVDDIRKVGLSSR
jgi:hypothetical protein